MPAAPRQSDLYGASRHRFTHPIAAMVIGMLAGAVPNASAQTIVLAEPTLDAGPVQRGTALKKDFVVKNTGTVDLLIMDVKPACGCAKATFDRVIKPGSQGKITFSVDTKGFNGRISKTADVLTNDLAAPSTKISLVADVRSAISVSPREWIRITQEVGTATTQDVTLSSDSPTFKPTKVTTPAPYLSAALSPGARPAEWKLTVTCDAGAPEGLLGGSVKVTTGVDEQPELSIPVSGIVRRKGAPAAATAGGAASGTKMTNEQVIELAKGGLSEEVIVNSLNQASGGDFDLTPTGLLALKTAGVSDKVIVAMQSRRATAPSGATSSGGEPPRAARDKSTSEPASPCADVDFLGVILAVSGGGEMAGWNAYGGRVRNRASYTKEVDFTWTMNGRSGSGTFRVPAGQFIDVNLGQGSVPPTNVRLVACR